MNYYNEHDPNAAAWLEELVAGGDLPPGLVDSRDAQDIGRAEPLDAYDQCHFFAGIGGWSHALDLAGWPRDRPIWTASLPCQPFSDAGKTLGVDDERHLWPTFHRLVEHYRPICIVGEQVASKAGRAWFATVQDDLAALGYRCGAVDLCAAGIGAPHIRQRLYWCAVRVADGDSTGLEVLREQPPWRELASVERGSTDSWDSVVYVPCADGKPRPLPRVAESCHEPLADGFPARLVRGSDPGAPQVAFPPLVTQQTDDLNDTNEARTMRLKGYGNAIVAPLAAEFISAFMEILGEKILPNSVDTPRSTR